MEIFSAKAIALMDRSAARDLYDMFNLQKAGLFDESQKAVFKKCIMFYSAVALENVPEHFDFSGIGNISAQKIKTDLTPVLRRAEHPMARWKCSRKTGDIPPRTALTSETG